MIDNIFKDKYDDLNIKAKGLFYLIYFNDDYVPLTVKVLIRKSKLSKKTLRKHLLMLVEKDLIKKIRFGHNNLKYVVSK